MFKSHSKEGFSLIEVTGVVLIIALLVLYGTPDVLDKVSYTEDVMLQNNILVIEDYISYNDRANLIQNKFIREISVDYLKEWLEEDVEIVSAEKTDATSYIQEILKNIDSFYMINPEKIEKFFATKANDGLYVYVLNSNNVGRVYFLKEEKVL